MKENETAENMGDFTVDMYKLKLYGATTRNGKEAAQINLQKKWWER